MSEEMKAETTAENDKQVPHLLTVILDLSHESFAGRGVEARVALHSIFVGLARTALQGADATLVQDGNGKALGVYMIGTDKSGEGRAAFDAAVKIISDEANGFTQVDEFVQKRSG